MTTLNRWFVLLFLKQVPIGLILIPMWMDGPDYMTVRGVSFLITILEVIRIHHISMRGWFPEKPII